MGRPLDYPGNTPLKTGAQTLRLRLSPRLVVGALAIVATVLVSLGVAGGYLRLAHDVTFRELVWLFDLGAERTFATWYASVSLLISATLLAVTAEVYRQRGQRRDSFYWWGLAAVFVLLSADEVSMFHEWTANLTGTGMRGFFFYSWVIFGLAFVGVMALIYLPFVLSRPRRLRLLLIASAVIFVGGALGMEMVNARLEDYHPDSRMTYMLLTALEEAMEKAGVLVFIYALLDHLQALGVTVVLRASQEEPRRTELMTT